MSSNRKGWIGVDLDGTLAHHDHWRGADHIGEPVPRMLERVKKWLAEGREVRIFTARISPCSCEIDGGTVQETRKIIEQWCRKHIGHALIVTCEKDTNMVELWDDRAVQVIKNSGVRADGFRS